jgi:hypothetical protein
MIMGLSKLVTRGLIIMYFDRMSKKGLGRCALSRYYSSQMDKACNVIYYHLISTIIYQFESNLFLTQFSGVRSTWMKGCSTYLSSQIYFEAVCVVNAKIRSTERPVRSTEHFIHGNDSFVSLSFHSKSD